MIKIYNFNNIDIKNKNTINRIIEIISLSNNNVVVSVTSPMIIRQKLIKLCDESNNKEELINFILNYFIDLSSHSLDIIRKIKLQINSLHNSEESILEVGNRIIVSIIKDHLNHNEILTESIPNESNSEISRQFYSGKRLFYDFDILVITENQFEQYYYKEQHQNNIVIKSVIIYHENYFPDIPNEKYKKLNKKLNVDIELKVLYFPDSITLFRKKYVKLVKNKKNNLGKYFW